ncbi:hypothetical protein ACFL4T_03620 [candidate division KSB1 bacterium]
MEIKQKKYFIQSIFACNSNYSLLVNSKFHFITIVLILLLTLQAFPQQPGIVDRFNNNPEDVYEYISNPILKNPEEIQRFFSDVRILYRELEKKKYDQNVSASRTFEMLYIYNSILRSEGPWTPVDNMFYVKSGFNIDKKAYDALTSVMRKSYFKVLSKFKRSLNADIPQGVIFVWIFESRYKFSTILNLSDEIGGLTYLSRFIFMPLEYYRLYDLPVADYENFERTFSHELAHSFFNSIVGIEHASSLPKWFKEGIAIYYGGDRKILFRGQTKRELSKEYKGYYDMFKYLRSDFGETKINELIIRTIQGENPLTLFENLFEYDNPEKYLSKKRRIFWMKFFVFVIILFLILNTVYKILRRFDVEINLTMYLFWIGLIIIGFVVYSTVFLMSIKSRIPLIINGSLLLLIILNDVIFNLRYRKHKIKLDIVSEIAELEAGFLELLDFYKYKSRRKKNKISRLLKGYFQKMDAQYNNIENKDRMNMYYSELNEKIGSTYDFRISDTIEEIMENFRKKVEDSENSEDKTNEN